MMMRKRPYNGKNRQEVKEKMAKEFVQIKNEEIPKGWSPESADFINKLLEKNEIYRLGNHGIEELKDHPWLKYYNWKDLYLMKEKAPFIPPRKVICSEENSSSNSSGNKKHEAIKNSELYKKAFINFAYFNRYSIKSRNYLTIFSNPHEIYEEIDKKEQEFNNKVHQMDEEFKKEKELIKKRGASLHYINKIKKKIINVDKNIVKPRKNTFQIDNVELPGPRCE
jgi:hypothetical protein